MSKTIRISDECHKRLQRVAGQLMILDGQRWSVADVMDEVIKGNEAVAMMLTVKSQAQPGKLFGRRASDLIEIQEQDNQQND